MQDFFLSISLAARWYILRYLQTHQTEANLAIVFGLTNIEGSRWSNPKRKYTENSGISTGW
jgi:hypothetical protein